MEIYLEDKTIIFLSEKNYNLISGKLIMFKFINS